VSQFSTAFRLSDGTLTRGSAPVLLFDVRTGPSVRVILQEVRLTLGLVTGSTDVLSIGVGLNSSAGTAKSNGIAFTSESGVDPVPNGLSVGIEWSTVPGVPANYFRRQVARDTSVNDMQEVWFRGLNIPIAPSSSMGVWIAAFTAFGIWSFPFDVESVVVDA
jgi:hypothetical protein